MVTRLSRALILAGTALCVLTACELATETVASRDAQIVVHAVLNPDVSEQVILVEASLTGRIFVDTTLRFDPLDPIRTGGGEAIAGADVRLFAEGDSVGVRARETRVNNMGTGRYVVADSQLALVPGREYRLRVRTTDGREVTGATRIPSAASDWVRGRDTVGTPVRFNRSLDTLQLSWPAVPDARTYAIRVETPNGPWFLFSDSARFSLAGSLRNFFASGLPAVWYPGFEQTVSIAAVDRNFYDYNRSGNDPFGGTGLISSVQGGIGLFGSARSVLRNQVRVEDRARFPLDADWRGRTSSGADVVLRLWVETPDDPRSSVSGELVNGPGRFLIGVLEGSDIRLASLAAVSSVDTMAFFIGVVSGDTITGTYDARFDANGPRRFVRQARAASVTTSSRVPESP